MANLNFQDIQHGDTVTIINAHGQHQKGKAYIFNEKYMSWVLMDPKKNSGGSGIIATTENTIKIIRKG